MADIGNCEECGTELNFDDGIPLSALWLCDTCWAQYQEPGATRQRVNVFALMRRKDELEAEVSRLRAELERHKPEEREAECFCETPLIWLPTGRSFVCSKPCWLNQGTDEPFFPGNKCPTCGAELGEGIARRNADAAHLDALERMARESAEHGEAVQIDARAGGIGLSAWPAGTVSGEEWTGADLRACIRAALDVPKTICETCANGPSRCAVARTCCHGFGELYDPSRYEPRPEANVCAGDAGERVVCRVEIPGVERPDGGREAGLTANQTARLLAAVSKAFPGVGMRGGWPGTMEFVVGENTPPCGKPHTHNPLDGAIYKPCGEVQAGDDAR